MPEATVAERIEACLPLIASGAKLLKTWPLKGGISATMTAFEIDLPDGRTQRLIARQPAPYRFRHDPRAADSEFRVLVALKEAGLPVQTPYVVEPSVPTPFFVIEYVEGRPEIDPPDRHVFLDRYVDQLVRIHRTTADLPFLPRQERDYESPRSVLSEDLREGEIRRALEAFGDRPSAPYVLRHGDYWPGNVLWRDGEIAAVIDWEEVLIGDPLADLAICRLDIWWILGEEGCEELTSIYQEKTGADLSPLPYWDLCASLRPITNIHEWSPSYPSLGRADITTVSMSRDHQEFVGRALSKL